MHNYCCIRNIYLNLQLIVYVFVELLFNNIRLCVWIAYLMRNVFPFSIYRVVGNLVWFFFLEENLFSILTPGIGNNFNKIHIFKLDIILCMKNFFFVYYVNGLGFNSQKSGRTDVKERRGERPRSLWGSREWAATGVGVRQ